MGFENEDDSGNDGRMPPLTATIIDVGVDYRDYGDDNEESRLIVIWKPDNDVFGVQTEILSNSGLLKVAPALRDIRVGGPERGFNIEIIGHIIQSGKLGYKAALWMAKLKSLGVRTPNDSGDLKELIGVKAVIKQLTYNEAKGRPKKDSEKVFWVPVEIIPTPEGKEQGGNNTEVLEDRKPVEPGVLPTLEGDILMNAEGKDENSLVEWYEGSRHYDGKSIVPLFMAIALVQRQGAMAEKDGVFKVGIKEPIDKVAPKLPADDLGPIDAEEVISPSKPGGGQ